MHTRTHHVRVCHVRCYNDVSRERNAKGREGGSVTDLALSRGFVTRDYRESGKTLSRRQFQRANVDVCTYNAHVVAYQSPWNAPVLTHTSASILSARAGIPLRLSDRKRPRMTENHLGRSTRLLMDDPCEDASETTDRLHRCDRSK